ncbi:MAG: hypothetical protein OEW12_03805 [Deltaproteobacteria bacterium]|nr:hypothetical protein [Deltaproteobacteria bacterium]
MKTHSLGTDTYAIFDHWNKGSVWMIHFLWGKKDFRLYMEAPEAAKAKGARGPLLRTKAGLIMVSRLQYLYNFQWYDYEGVGGHGLAREETRWVRGREKRTVELPKDFFEVAVDLACLEFGITREKAKAS